MSLTNKPEIICTWKNKYLIDIENKTVEEILCEAIVDNTVPYTPDGIDSIVWHVGGGGDCFRRATDALNILEVTYIIYKIVNIETVMKTVKLEFIYK